MKLTGTKGQIGRDRRDHPTGSKPISEGRIAMGRLAVVITVVAWLAYFVDWLIGEFIDSGGLTARYKAEAVVYLIVVTLLTASALAYLCCRLGYFYRGRDHQRAPRAALDDFFARTEPTLTVIVPSYKEDRRIIRTTLLSAALQEYPYQRVVLLIDDPPNPSKKRDRRALEEARALPGQLQELLEQPRAYFTAALETYERARTGVHATVEEMVELAGHFDFAVNWLNAEAEATEIVDHTDRFFVEQVLQGLAADFTMTGSALRAAAADGVVLPGERLRQLYRRLLWTFRSELTSFERKQYASLSHDANKAMNLNSYIGLMGGSYKDVVTVGGRVLLPATPGSSDLEVPDPDYVLTLDADSILLPEYCIRLVHLMEQSEHARVAVAQTPYSAYPGAATRLERLAGATTDIQYMVHQGMTHYGATFWVGANAVLRKQALDEVKQTTYEGNWPICRYIQDRTVIEDTESTVDLGTHGWRLLNYPERLSYSATPPDFGALCIQRRRWANGGLLIMPKLWRQRRQRRKQGIPAPYGEFFLRTNYMSSIAWSSVSLLLLLAYPFRNQLVSPLLGLIALPYFVGMASDLRFTGYKRSDVVRIYGFNLILLPVNLVGVGNSIVQSITGDKSVFGRTPKVRNRTVPNLLFIVTPYVILALAAFTLYQDYRGGRWVNGIYAGLNTVLTVYAIVAYIGIRHSISDLYVQLKARLYKPVKPAKQPAATPASIVANPPTVDWASVLHFGGTDVQRIMSGRQAVPIVEASSITPQRRSVLPAAPTRWASSNIDEGFWTVFQPIVALADGTIVGYEALSRLDDGIAPDRRLAMAAEAGYGIELEILMARSAVSAARALPTDTWLGINVSAQLALAGRALELVSEETVRPIVFEVDHRLTPDRADMAAAIASLPNRGQVALAGITPGYDNFTLIEELAPRYVKLDPIWVRDIQDDKARQALIGGLAAMAVQSGFDLIAEGIETDAELTTLQSLGVRVGQGFLLGRPSRAVPQASV